MQHVYGMGFCTLIRTAAKRTHTHARAHTHTHTYTHHILTQIMAKLGAIMAAGILDAGGRNVGIGLRSRSGFFRRTSVVGLAVFTQYWCVWAWCKGPWALSVAPFITDQALLMQCRSINMLLTLCTTPLYILFVSASHR
eukprot:1139475-Pelagomonas_calceolata.AAC.8